MFRIIFALLLFAGMAQSSEREIAEWVIRWEGQFTTVGSRQVIGDLSEIPEDEFRISSVDLTGSVMPPSEFAKLSPLTSLRELYLPGPVWNPGAGGEDANDAFKALASLTNLERIGVGWHFSAQINIQDEGFEQLLGLTELKDIRCAQCRLTDINLAPLTKLRSLDLSHSPFSDTGMAGLAGMTHLRRLILPGTMVTDGGLKHISGLTDLEELNLSGTRITERGLENLRGMTKMRKLDLLGAEAGDGSMEILAEMPDLEVVSLYRTKITNAGLVQLHGLTKLTDIDLRYSRVTANGLESLRTALPDATIEFVGSTNVQAMAAGAERPAEDTNEAIGAWVTAMGGKVEFSGDRLIAVDLSSTPVSDGQLSHLAGLSGLEKLNLAVTQVGDLGLHAIEGLVGLKELDLSLTTVSDAGLAKLAGLRGLEVLKLGGTLVEGRGFDVLKNS